MSIQIPIRPQQVAPPGRVGERIWIDTVISSTTTTRVSVRYEPRPAAAKKGYQVVEGAERSMDLLPGSNAARHWIVLAGPGTNVVVEMRIVVAESGVDQPPRGFAIALHATPAGGTP
jgi:hypothetical protein